MTKCCGLFSYRHLLTPALHPLHNATRVCFLAVLRSSSSQQSFESVRVKMLQLSSMYGRSERFFPRDYLTLTLEKRACELCWDIGSVCGVMRATGVAVVDLFKIYDKLFKAKVGVCGLGMCGWMVV